MRNMHPEVYQPVTASATNINSLPTAPQVHPPTRSTSPLHPPPPADPGDVFKSPA